ncbi:SAM-dependent methyltransferase [Alisedimentitalea sp. MJ-SS2]|uniref:class I SAM-dependent methyltransferase n=1 Tax=Aliisedimentitalea sp. MJ-SS2 TaxID=3049795 RepID=UPI00290D16BE|nr:SAM-dependent methyltransferase [Alisedimentitalea sp. MJ-SS2]MDU8927338.1 SAM-dependent methyltransferase [Alisedimentitalea sp. MJ-SS2]
MSPLSDHLRDLIASQGPIPVSDYMALCLMHPEHGYYATRDPFGASGDFITAPEISQMFGELIGLSLAQAWMDQGVPNRFTLAELGPGRGTLMADILRATRSVPGFQAAAQIHLIEASPTLKSIQAETLEGYCTTWSDRITALPDQPLYLVANEFFDALPIRQFVRSGLGWCERQIGWNEGLTFGLAPETRYDSLTHRLDDTKDGDLVEQCPASVPIATQIGQQISSQGGTALIIDYGDWHSLGDTLQALENHAPVNPLQNPGNADLTAHVDFEALAMAAPCAHTKLTPQGVFLERLGITQRAQSLAQNLSGKPLETHIAAHRRLTHPAEMGTLFKVLGLYPHGTTPPPGLDP